MKKKSVIQIVSRLNIGGPSRVILYNHQKLLHSDLTPYIFTGHPPAYEAEIDIPAECRENLIYIKGLGPKSGIFKTISAFFEIRKLLKEIKPIAIHSHQSKAGLFGRVCGFLTRVPIRIHTYHGHVFFGYFSPLKTKIIKLLEKCLSKLSTTNISISNQIHHDVVHVYKVSPKEKTAQIPVGIHPDFFNLNPNKVEYKKKFNLPQDKKLIGFVGRLEPIKAPEDFIRMAKNYCEKNTDCHFVIAGGGDLDSEIEMLIADNKLSGFITKLNWVNKIEEILICLDLLVLTSKNEGTPLIIMEAMALNTPVLATKVGGIPDLIEHNKTGFLFSEKKETFEIDLENTLKTNPEKLNQIKKKAYENVKSNFTLDYQYERILKIYNK